MTKNGLTLLIETGGTLLAIAAVERLSAPLGWLPGLLLAVLGASVLMAVLRLGFLEMPMRSYRFRRRIDPAAAFEGHWLVTVDQSPETRYSYARLRYNFLSKSYMLEGFSFGPDLSLMAEFRTDELVTDAASERIWYVYEAWFKGELTQISGYGWIRFSRTQSGAVISGSGFFVDFRGKTAPSHQTLRRIPDDTLEHAHLTDVASADDARRLLSSLGLGPKPKSARGGRRESAAKAL